MPALNVIIGIGGSQLSVDHSVSYIYLSKTEINEIKLIVITFGTIN